MKYWLLLINILLRAYLPGGRIFAGYSARQFFCNPQSIIPEIIKSYFTASPVLPIWDLMLKNVYTIGYGILTPSDFKLDVLYQEPGLGAKRYVPFGDKNQGTPIISLNKSRQA